MNTHKKQKFTDTSRLVFKHGPEAAHEAVSESDKGPLKDLKGPALESFLKKTNTEVLQGKSAADFWAEYKRRDGSFGTPSSKGEIGLLQAVLTNLNVNTNPKGVDGVAGLNTRKALKNFQEIYNNSLATADTKLKESGVFDAETMQALDEFLAEGHIHIKGKGKDVVGYGNSMMYKAETWDKEEEGIKYRAEDGEGMVAEEGEDEGYVPPSEEEIAGYQEKLKSGRSVTIGGPEIDEEALAQEEEREEEKPRAKKPEEKPLRKPFRPNRNGSTTA